MRTGLPSGPLQERDLIIAYTKERADGLQSCKSVFDDGPVSVSLSCRHCENPLCVASCIAGALTKDPDGRTVYDESSAWAAGPASWPVPTGPLPDRPEVQIIKCDLCPDREVPACVEACPNEALVFEDREEQ